MRTQYYDEPRPESPSITVFVSTTIVTSLSIQAFSIPRLWDSNEKVCRIASLMVRSSVVSLMCV